MKKLRTILVVCFVLLGALTACDTSGAGTGSTGTGGDPGGALSPISTATAAP